MPRGLGTFTRTNGQFSGAEIWQDDLEAQKKIIALRHDTHDEDLALGIAACLPKDGSESMLNSLDMGNFAIANVLAATPGVLHQAPNHGQIVTSMSFDEPTRTLTLVREGMTNMAVTIQSGGDNTIIQEGIEQIFAGTGIQFANGNEMSEGNPIDTISLTDIAGVSGTYSLPTLTVNAQGRITNISGGTGAIDLAAAPGTTNVVIENTGGTNATILDATTSRAGVMTKQQVIDLGNAVAGTGTNLSVGSRSNSTLFINSSTGNNVSVPRATNSQAGIITGTEYAALIAGSSGDPDQTISLSGHTANDFDLVLSGNGSTVNLPQANTGSAGLMNAAAVKQIAGLAVDGSGNTRECEFNTDPTGMIFWDHTRTPMYVPDWSTQGALAIPGVFYGLVKSAAPTQGEADAQHDNTVWFVY